MAAKKLTPKQARFAEEYLLDLNAAAAYRRAGYKARTDHEASVGGSRLLANTGIKVVIAASQARRAQRSRLSQDWVLERLKVEAELTGEGAGHGARVKALELLGKHVGMWPNRLDVKHTGGVRLELVEEIVDADDSP